VFAQDISINLGQSNGGVTERAIRLIALLTVLSIAPSILIMMTSFTRIVAVLSLLRTALGTATARRTSVKEENPQTLSSLILRQSGAAISQRHQRDLTKTNASGPAEASVQSCGPRWPMSRGTSCANCSNVTCSRMRVWATQLAPFLPKAASKVKL
jgi:hypothetical protein